MTLANVQFGPVASAFSQAAIVPTGTDSGAICSVTDIFASVDLTPVTNNVVCVTTGLYYIRTRFAVSRSTNTNTAIIGIRWRRNGIQQGNTQVVRLKDTYTIPVELSGFMTMNAGDIFSAQIIRDSAGENDGSLVPQTITNVGWTTAPAYEFYGQRIIGAS